MVLVAEKRSPSALHKVLLSPPRQPSLFQLRVCSSAVWGPRRLNGSCRLGRNWKPPVCFRPGSGKLDELTAAVAADDSLPAEARQAIAELHRHCNALGARIATFEGQIIDHARKDAVARLLATIPGVGPITASLIAATVGDNIGAFKSARHFAAWLGLVPRQHSTGGKTRLGRITKIGSADIRRLLVLGAPSMIYRAAQWNSAAGKWIMGVLSRRPARLATVALANKMARIAWAVMTRKQVYQAQGHALTAAEAAA